MKVSVITPTYGRPHLLEPLYRLFDHQVYPDKELLILDDSPSPSPAMHSLRDPRVRYMHSTTRMTLGAKRDRLVREASGDVIVHFDDDDYYSPSYVVEMVDRLNGYDMVKLSGWFIFDVRAQHLFFWETQELSHIHYALGKDLNGPVALDMTAAQSQGDAWIVDKMWGYGFSYVFRRGMYLSVQFDASVNHGEDYGFARRCLQAGLRLRAVPDYAGLCLHVIHGGHLSRVFPNYRVPSFFLDRLFGSEVRRYLRESHGVPDLAEEATCHG